MKLQERVELASMVLQLGFNIVLGWQVAKIMCPGLAVHEATLRASLRNRRKPCHPSKGDVDGFVADVTRYVRSKEQ